MPAEVPARPSQRARASWGALRCTQTVAQTLTRASVTPMPSFDASMESCVAGATASSCSRPKRRQQEAFQKRPTTSRNLASRLMSTSPQRKAVATWPNLSMAPSMPRARGDQPLFARELVQNCVAPPS